MMNATYSPDDNKLRLYATARLPRDIYDRVKAAGFKWAPKQELFVAPMWTPEREDLLLELCGEIGDEDTSLVERQEERAERFEDYSDKREAEADRAKAAVDSIADAIPMGQPILVGHHSEKRARKDAERIKAGLHKAVSLWRTSKYWSDRAAGALHHAKYKERADVRARRIKGIESDKRKAEKNRDEAIRFLKYWSREGLTIEQARGVANISHLYVEGTWTAWDVLRPDEERYSACPAMTLEQVIEHAKAAYPRTIERQERWIEHYDNRLAYERAMLADAGGTVTDRNAPEKGGACRCWCSPGFGKGWSYIKKVNKVSVTVEDNFGNGGANFTRTIPFDKLSAVMSAAEVELARAEGRISEATTGFFLGGPVETKRESAERVHREAVANRKTDEKDAAFESLSDALKSGVKVIVAPQLFPTPPEVARQVVELAGIKPGRHTVLEPSAGTGNLIRAVYALPLSSGFDANFSLVAVEISGGLCENLRRNFPGIVTVNADFLEWHGNNHDVTGCGFDRIVMNPPFTNGADVKHIEHALKCLKPGGRLVSVVANGPRQREKLMPLASEWIDLPAGTFADQGTNVNTAIVVIDKE